MRHAHVMAEQTQQYSETLSRIHVVVDNEDPAFGGCGDLRMPVLRGRCLPWRPFSQTRQPDNKLAAGARTFASRLDRAAVHFDQAAHQSQPDAESTLRMVQDAVRLDKGL